MFTVFFYLLSYVGQSSPSFINNTPGRSAFRAYLRRRNNKNVTVAKCYLPPSFKTYTFGVRITPCEMNRLCVVNKMVSRLSCLSHPHRRSWWYQVAWHIVTCYAYKGTWYCTWCPSVLILQTQCLRNTWHNSYNHSGGLKNELIRCWRSKVTVTSYLPHSCQGNISGMPGINRVLHTCPLGLLGELIRIWVCSTSLVGRCANDSI